MSLCQGYVFSKILWWCRGGGMAAGERNKNWGVWGKKKRKGKLNETWYSVKYRMSKKAEYPASHIFGTTLVCVCNFHDFQIFPVWYQWSPVVRIPSWATCSGRWSRVSACSPTSQWPTTTPRSSDPSPSMTTLSCQSFSSCSWC